VLGSGRYRSQFRNNSANLRNDIDSLKLHQYCCLWLTLLSLPLFSPPLSNEDRRRANPERQQEDQQDTD